MQTTTFIEKNIFFSACLLFLFTSIHTFSQVGINTTDPKSTFEVNGSYGQTATTITSSTTLDETHNTIICNNGSSAITVTLPTAVGISGRIYTILRNETSTANVTIATTSSQTINGATSLVLKNTKESVMLISNNTNWKTTGSNNSSNASSDYLLFPMGEISYFNTTGATVSISAQSNGTSNMVLCNPASTLTSGGMDFDNGGSNSGRLRYTGTVTKNFHVACTISASASATNDQFVFGVAKNGTVIVPSKVIQKLGSTADTQSTALHVMISLANNEYLELYAGNMTSASNVKINSLCLFALGMGM